MSESNATTVQIFGREYRIKGGTDDAYIRSVASYVDEKMREVTDGTSLPSTDRLAILTALNIADELFQLRQASTSGLTDIESKAEHLIELLDDAFLAAD